MSKILSEKKANSSRQLSRRNFLGYAGAATGLFIGISSCNKQDQIQPMLSNNQGTQATVNLGSGDIGILNYAYALEQLEAAFYTMVIMTPYSGMSTMETSLITGVRDHEIAHREFFKNALADKAIGQLQFDFSSVNFSSRTSVLTTAKAFEDLGVSAYNGAGRLIMNPDYLAAAGKIVSVEGRHAAFFRELLAIDTFADDTVVDAMGLDVTRRPSEVLPIASPYIVTEIDASNLPTY
jgi:hypothetical protein